MQDIPLKCSKLQDFILRAILFKKCYNFKCLIINPYIAMSNGLGPSASFVKKT